MSNMKNARRVLRTIDDKCVSMDAALRWATLNLTNAGFRDCQVQCSDLFVLAHAEWAIAHTRSSDLSHTSRSTPPQNAPLI